MQYRTPHAGEASALTCAAPAVFLNTASITGWRLLSARRRAVASNEAWYFAASVVMVFTEMPIAATSMENMPPLNSMSAAKSFAVFSKVRRVRGPIPWRSHRYIECWGVGGT